MSTWWGHSAQIFGQILFWMFFGTFFLHEINMYINGLREDRLPSIMWVNLIQSHESFNGILTSLRKQKFCQQAVFGLKLQFSSESPVFGPCPLYFGFTHRIEFTNLWANSLKWHTHTLFLYPSLSTENHD